MQALTKMLIMTGIILILIGVSIHFLGKIPGFGRLPGDILIKKENFTFFFPLTTCILISIILSLIFFLWNQR